MTPLGLKIRELRDKKGVTQKQMAEELGVSAAYLSALEHGHRGMPNWHFLQRLIGYFNIIWDEADALQKLAISSHTRVVVDTEKLSADATSLANILSQQIANLSEEDCRALIVDIEQRAKS